MRPETYRRMNSIEKEVKRDKALFARIGVAALAVAAMAATTRPKNIPEETPTMNIQEIEDEHSKITPTINIRPLPSSSEIPDASKNAEVIQFTPVVKIVEEPAETPSIEVVPEGNPGAERLAIDQQILEHPHTDPSDIVEPDPSELISSIPALGWEGPVLTPDSGHINGPTGDETYYNLPMDYVVGRMRRMGNEDSYWIRQDGVKMLGNYVMVAANLDVHPRGSIVETSLGTGIVCDTGGFAKDHPQRLDIATVWKDPEL